MVPSTWLSVVFFILLVAPGLLFYLLAEHRRVGPPESTFREVSRVILASLLFSSLGLLLVGITRALCPAWMPDPSKLFADPSAYLATRYRLVLRALVVEGAIALGAVAILHWALSKKDGSGLRPVSSWRKVFREELPNNTLPYARVRLTGGTVFLGHVRHYTADLDLEDREIVLAPPLFSKTGSNPLAPMPPEWQTVVLPASEIESIAVSYRPQP